MRDEPWLTVDTETNGLMSPVYAVEIAAQRMRGWQRAGESFRVLLNHDVRIDPAAEAVHGYSQEFLRANGLDPREAHKRFHDYARDLPVVAYNLSFDWNRCLAPEYERLAVPVTGRKGFCAMTLARRTISETTNYKLETLRQYFQLTAPPSHCGRNDVETLCGLFERVFEPRLTKVGILGFDNICSFSRVTPVARCLEEVMGLGLFADKKKTTDRGRSAILGAVATKSELKSNARWVDEIITLSRDILSDGVVTEAEILKLQEWLMSCPCTRVYPIDMIADTVERIVCDGIITQNERKEMQACLTDVLRVAG